VLVDQGAGWLMVWETFPRNYFFIFFSPLEFKVRFLLSPNCRDGFMRLSKKEMELDMHVITDLTQLSSAAFKWCMTSPSSV